MSGEYSPKIWFQYVILAALVAVAKAGILGAPAVSYAAPAVSYAAPAVSYAAPAVSYAAPAVSYAAPAVTSQQSNILRSYGNLGQVSTYSKTIDTPYSSVRKSDVRVSNDALAYPAAQAVAAYAAPAVAAAPVAYAAPAVRVAPAVAAPLGVAYSAAPAVAHLSFSGLGVNYGW
jgi:hypothetical protein